MTTPRAGSIPMDGRDRTMIPEYISAVESRVGGWLPRAEERLTDMETKERNLTGIARATIARQVDELYQQIEKARADLAAVQEGGQ